MMPENQFLVVDLSKLKPNEINEMVYTEEEHDQGLVDSIKEKGQLEPLVVIEDKDIQGNYIIISGHRRSKALKTLGLKANCRLVSFDDELEMKEAIIEYNKYRKKKPSQIVNEANLLRSIYAEKAEKRKKATLKQNTDVPNSAQRENYKIEAGTTRDKVADAVGIGRDKLDKLTKIKEKADSGDEHAKILMKILDNDELTTNGAFKYLEVIETAKSEAQEKDYALYLLDQIKRDKITPNEASLRLKKLKEKIESIQKKVNIPTNYEGNYSVLFADFSSSIIPLEDYMHLDFPDTRSSVLCILTTNPFLKESFEMMDWWGFEYNSICIWDRDVKDSTSLFSRSYKLLLLGTKGDLKLPDLENRFPSIISNKKRNECAHDLVKKMFPNQRYIDLFLKEEHKGWDTWILEERKEELKETKLKIEPLVDDSDINESIKMILMSKKKQDDTQNLFDEWY
jgi:ParB/RepB/Spo0J family partition protein